MRRGLVVGAVLACAGCPPPNVETELPALSGALTAEIVSTLGGPGGPRDPRALVVVGTVLYVADVDGLFVYDVAVPAAPTLLATVAGRVDDIAVDGNRAYTIQISGTHRLTEIDVSTPAAPQVLREVASRTLVFGGIAARSGLIWHAVGANPPSRVFRDLGSEHCDAPDRERGAMDIWLGDGLAFETIHFDDFAGDGLDGNGAYGLASFVIENSPGRCPSVTLGAVLFFETHAKNRSQFERGSQSDLQAALHPGGGLIYVTGEQRLRSVAVDAEGRMTELDALPIPDVLAVAVDASRANREVIAVGNGDLVLVDARDPAALEAAVIVPSSGITRAVAFATDGRHVVATNGAEGLVIVRYDVVVP